MVSRLLPGCGRRRPGAAGTFSSRGSARRTNAASFVRDDLLCRIAVKENYRIAGALVDVVHAPAVDALEFRLVRPFLVRGPLRLSRCIHSFVSLSKEDHSLTVEAREPDNSAEAFAAHEIEDDDFVSSHAVELA